jgi:Fe-S-cluster containining protein
MMEVREDYYNKYKEMFEFRGLFGVQKSGKYYFMTQKCKHLIYTDDGRYVCGIQDTKPEICKEFPQGSRECLEARAFWERTIMMKEGKELAKHPPIAPEHFTEKIE